MNKIVKIGSCTLIAAIWMAAASAAPPFITTTFVGFDFPVVECDGYVVWTRGDEKDTEKLFFDQNGVPVRFQLKIQILASEYYNGSDPAISISQGVNGVGENVTINVDLVTGEQHNSGAAFRLTIPGIGHVLMLVGNTEIDSMGNVVHHGLNFVLAEGETGPALCEALAP